MKDKPLWPLTSSATLLSLGAIAIANNKLSIGGRLSGNEKFWTVVAVAYAIVLTGSGWYYRMNRWRSIGIVHGVMMLGIAGIVFFEIGKGILVGPTPDNAAAGVLAAANVIFLCAGAGTALCGIWVLRDVFVQIGDIR